MRHIISLMLQNEAGALTRVAGLFSSRGYNIESLHVAPTQDITLSRLTLVTSCSDSVMHQICSQLHKLVDVVSLYNMTHDDHFERELVLIKLELSAAPGAALSRRMEGATVRVLDERLANYTLEIVGSSRGIDEFIAGIDAFPEVKSVLSVVRSGALAISRGTPLQEWSALAP